MHDPGHQEVVFVHFWGSRSQDHPNVSPNYSDIRVIWPPTWWLNENNTSLFPAKTSLFLILATNVCRPSWYRTYVPDPYLTDLINLVPWLPSASELFRQLLLCHIVVAFRVLDVLVLQPGGNYASSLTEQPIFPWLSCIPAAGGPMIFHMQLHLVNQEGSHHPQANAIDHGKGLEKCLYRQMYTNVISFLVVCVRDSCRGHVLWGLRQDLIAVMLNQKARKKRVFANSVHPFLPGRWVFFGFKSSEIWGFGWVWTWIYLGDNEVSCLQDCYWMLLVSLVSIGHSSPVCFAELLTVLKSTKTSILQQSVP